MHGGGRPLSPRAAASDCPGQVPAGVLEGARSTARPLPVCPDFSSSAKGLERSRQQPATPLYQLCGWRSNIVRNEELPVPRVQGLELMLECQEKISFNDQNNQSIASGSLPR